MSLAPLLLALVPAALAADGVGQLPAPVLVGGAVLVAVVVILVAVRDQGLGILAAAVSGALASAYLTVQHHVARAGGESICNVSSVINCDKINTLPESEVGGVPIALYGLGFYAAVGYLAYAARGDKGRSAASLLVLGGALAVAYDVFLAWTSYQSGAVCIFCALTWVLNLTILVAAVKLARAGGLGLGEGVMQGLGEHGGLTIVVGLSVFVVGVVVSRQPGTTPGGGSAGAHDFSGLYEMPGGRIVLDGTEPVRGNPAARFTILEWADYQCPHCGVMAPVLKAIVDSNDDVKMLFKNYPINSNCNRFVQASGHENACAAAAAAECARLQGRFWELSEAMFKNQSYLSPPDLRFMAERQGIDLASFDACLASAAALDAVTADVESGGVAEIEGTPSIFLLGTHGDQWVRLTIGPGDKDRVNALLAAARAGTPLPEPTPHAPHPE